MTNRTLRSARRRMALWRAAKGVCAICKKPLDPRDMEADHIEPYSRTKRTNYHELQPTHSWCNRQKGSK
jgi:5-methylcytosine-specific restriction endonuclease McrA